MLYRNDNPVLFQCVATALEQIDPTFNSLTAPSMTDEQLQKITRLQVRRTFSSLESLEGIEQLKNLETLVVIGNDYYQCALNYKEQEEIQQHFKNFDYTEDFKFIEDIFFNDNQISQADLERLYELKNLKMLNLSNQRKIEKMDLSKLPNLEVLLMRSSSIESVSGLSKCKAVQNGDREYHFDFSGCESLSVNDLPELYESIKNAPSFNMENEIIFPVLTYARCFTDLQKSSNETLRDIASDDLANEIFKWAEIDQGGVNAVVNSKQMEIATDRCMNIIRHVCQDNPESDVEKISRWYRYICDKITYDTERLQQSEAKPTASMTKKEREQLINQTRSMFFTLFREKGVCTGIRNLFNFGTNLMNITALPINCLTKEKSSESSAIADHAISFVETQNGIPYFLDPTWDLGTSQSRYFMLTKEEMENANHIFTLEGKKFKNGISVRRELSSFGLDRTQIPFDEKPKDK